MTILLVFLALTIALGVASALGWTVDSRDHEYRLGAVIEGRNPAAGR